MRKKGLIVLVVIAALVCIWMFVFSDKWLERRLESLASRVVGAKVELDSFDFSLFSMSMRWARLQVTDPEDTWKNIFQTGYCSFNLASGPLFQKKFIVEDLSLLDLRFNTQRETDGKLEIREKPRGRKSSKLGEKIGNRLESELSKLPIFNYETLIHSLDIDALWQSALPQTPERIDGLVKEYEQFSSRWNERFRDLDFGNELTGLREELAKIDIEKLKTVDDSREALERIDRISERVNNSVESMENIGIELEKDITRLDEKQAGLEEWVEEDIARAQNAIQLPDLTLENVAKVIFGRRIVERVQKVLRIINKIRTINEKIRRFIPIKEIPPRLKGQDIRFPQYKKLPDLWVKKISFSGYTADNLQITGSVMDLTSEQNLIGRPTVLYAAGLKQDGGKLALKGIFDYRTDPAREVLELEMTGIVLQNMWLTDFPLLPNTIENGSAGLSARLEFAGPDLLSSVSVVIKDLTLEVPQTNQGASEIERRISEISRSVAQDISSIRVDAGLEILSDETRFSVHSNLDSLIYSKINGILMKDVENVRVELEKKVQEMIDESKERLETVSSEVAGTLESRLDDLEGTGDLLEKEVEKKRLEIQKKIEEETIGREKRKLEEEKKKREEEMEEEKRKKEEELKKAKERKEQELQQELQKKIEKLF